MNRRSFFSSIAAFAGAASLSPNIFIPKFEPVKWKAIVPPPKFLSCSAFTQFFIDQAPVYDKSILKDVGGVWLGHMQPGRYDPMSRIFK